MFKKSRRAPRRVGRDDEEESERKTADVGEDDEPSSVVKRPVITSKLNKTKRTQQSSLRASFAPGREDDEADAGGEDDAFAAVERKRAAARANRAALASARLPIRSPDSASERPSYSKDYLNELKDQQQTTPRPVASDDADLAPVSDIKPINLASKFGVNQSSAVIRESETVRSVIPTDAEIQEKKERRRRLAAEQKADDYIALDDSNSGSESSDDQHKGSLIQRAEEMPEKSKYGESRLGGQALDEDDFAEGYDAFVDDPGRVAIGRKALREQDKARRADIAAQIRSAEGNSSDGVDDVDDDEDQEENARLRAYETAQTKRGTYASRRTAARHREKEREQDREEQHRRKSMKQYKPRPIPDLKSAVANFKALVERRRQERIAAEKQLEDIRREREEIAKEEVRIQALVKEAGERLQRLTTEKEIKPMELEGPPAAEFESSGKDALQLEGGALGTSNDSDDNNEQSMASQFRPPVNSNLAVDDDRESAAREASSKKKITFHRGTRQESESSNQEEPSASGLGLGMQAGVGASNDIDGRPTSFAGMGRPPSPEW